MTTSTSLALRALLKKAVAAGQLDRPASLVAGLSPSAQALLVSAAAGRDATVLLVVATDADVEQMTSDVRFFLGALEGLSAHALDRAVLPFPSPEVDPYRGMTPHLSVASARARALHALASGHARVVVASAAALLPRLSEADRLLSASVELKPGSEIEPRVLAALLADAGYNPEDPVDEHGEFCVRGGVLDFFPSTETHPIRLEFIGDTIESIRRYDPSTQRSIAPLDQIAIVPHREVFEAVGPGAGEDEEELDRSATLFDYLGRARNSLVYVSELEDVRSRIAKLVEQIEASYESTQQGDSDDAPGHDAVPGAAADDAEYWRVGDEEDLQAVDGADLDMEDRAALRAIDANLRASRVPTPRRLPPPAELLVPLDDIEAMLTLGTRLSELEIQDEPAERGAADADAGALDNPERDTPAPRPQPPAASAAQRPGVPASRPLQPTGVLSIRCQPAVGFHGRLADWAATVRAARERGEQVLFIAGSAGRAERIVEVLKEYEILALPVDRAEDSHAATVLVAVGSLSRGFRLPDAAFQLFAENDVFEEEHRAPERRRSVARTFLSDLRDLKVGDLVVHVDHGIGVFVGLKQIRPTPGDDATQEFMELRYAGEDKLFVPVERLDLIQKYSGATRPPLDRLGGTTWERAKTKVRKAMRDMAEELLKLYAARKAVEGYRFAGDTHWQEEFEDAFEWELTPDQRTAITDIKRDMESGTPMDRLLCGDVGYGKTEVAMRAAFKAVMDGKQVAFLAPTTVLAFQHLKTLRERFAAFPVRSEMVSRFRSKAEQKKILEDLAEGRLEIIVGTHRLLSKDVKFRDLGLLVVDEEQRFGVAHKEKIKQLRRRVDVLTMSATPIPRTLNMSLVGIRDMSIIETPPKDRLSIQTNVVKFDQQVITRAIRGELARGGQVYFVHNRVESIFSIASLLHRLVPEARVVVGHGQMGEDQLERAMVDFVERKFDILLATTIIENGLDIPNVNTIVINRADRYGLSQLYQLRGRVGRSDRPAYAYLLIPPEDSLTPVARKRLAAIKEFSDLGSGFRVAALDLEIRGAGNLLGGEQSGHIEAVGFEMYMKLLEQTVREMKGEEVEDEVRAAVNLGIDLRIDEAYVPDMNQRLMLYRRMAGSRSEAEVERTLEETRDRYGPLPDSVLNLADYARIRVMADQLGLETIDRQGPLVVLRFRTPGGTQPAGAGAAPFRASGNGPGNGRAQPAGLGERVVRMLSERTDVTLAPPAVLKLDLKKKSDEGDGRPARGSKAPVASGGGRLGRSMRIAPAGRRYESSSVSWWTARASAGVVTPGFSKEEILKPRREDPRGPDGVLTRVGGLLAELIEG